MVLTVDSWALGYRPADLRWETIRKFRGFCMENYYSDENFTKHLAKPPHEDQAAALRYYANDLRSTRCPGKTFVGFGRRPICRSR